MGGIRALRRRSMHLLRQRNVRAALLVVVIGGTALMVSLFVAGKRSDAQTTYPHLWPSFTMTYTTQVFDPPRGKLTWDQTVQLEVINEYNWHEQVIRDGLNPRAVGSTREFKDRRVCYYSTEMRAGYCLNPLDAYAITSITADLRPDRSGDMQYGRTPGFQDATPSQPGRVAKTREQQIPCATPGARDCRDSERVEWLAPPPNAPYAGVIAVYGERRFNGRLWYTFRADSVEVKGMNDAGRP